MSEPYRLLDLFSGIGGFSLGLERSGAFKTVAFCEIEPFCRRVLAKHWPDVPCYDDIRTLTAERLRADGISVDAICGGFPCQDISTAGNGIGIEGERSALWTEYARLIGELRPRYVLVENVSALLSRGMDKVLGDLASLGYDAEWHCISASAVGAPHRRDRVWIVANSLCERYSRQGYSSAAAYNKEWDASASEPRGRTVSGQAISIRQIMADALRLRSQGQGQSLASERSEAPENREATRTFDGRIGHEWTVEPAVGRVANGVPNRVDRLRALGNAVVPQIPELIGRAIAQAERAA